MNEKLAKENLKIISHLFKRNKYVKYRGSEYNRIIRRKRKIIPKAYTSKKVKQIPILINQDVISYIREIQNRYVKLSIYKPTLNVVFGQKENVVTDVVPIFSSYGGCYEMGSIDADAMAEAMYSLVKMDCFPAGIGRIGVFGKSFDRGNGLYQLRGYIKDQGIFMLSLGWTVFFIEFPNKKGKFIRHSYKIIKKGGTTNAYEEKASKKESNKKVRRKNKCHSC